MDWKALLFGFDGRINRAKYWLSLLVISGVAVIGMIGAFTIGIGSGLFIFINPFVIIGFVLAAWISLATAAKRLHDRNKSGWWLIQVPA